MMAFYRIERWKGSTLCEVHHCFTRKKANTIEEAYVKSFNHTSLMYRNKKLIRQKQGAVTIKYTK